MPPLADEPEGPGLAPLGQMKSVHHRDATDIVQRNMNVKAMLQCAKRITLPLRQTARSFAF
jgi:hypothetical protein